MNAYMCIATINNPDLSDMKFQEFNNLEYSIKLSEVSKDYKVIISNYTNIWINKDTNKEIEYNCIDSKEPIQINNNYIDKNLNKENEFCWGFSAENINEKLINEFKEKFITVLKKKFEPQLINSYTDMYNKHKTII